MTPDLVGQTVGNFRVVRLLGEGGMGAVYEAEHPDLARRVAIKVMAGALARNDEVVARFLREARAANRVRHPQLVEVLDLGRLASGPPYMVMELLEGETLRRRLARGALPVGEALSVFEGCAAALASLHAAGVVHRDLKPDNIFLVDKRATAQAVKILDLGIAKVLDGAEPLTSTGALLGTPAYMAPEQIEGGAIDARTDIYAMGCVLYEMLTGRAPFDGATMQKLMLQHLTAEPPAPDGAPPAIAAAVRRALAKLPADRFSSIAEMAAALGAAPIVVATSPRSPRGRWAIAAGLGALGVVVVVAVVAGSSRSGATPARADAAVAFDPAVAFDAAVAVARPDAAPMPTTCAAGDPIDCLARGAASDDRGASHETFVRAFALVATRTDPPGRFLRGVLLAFGVGTVRDVARAKDDLATACQGGEHRACDAMRCLVFGADADARLAELKACAAAGTLDGALLEATRASVVAEVMEGP